MAYIGHITNSTTFLLNNLVIKSDKQRPYLGASSIGSPCARKLWYSFHFSSKREPIDGRTSRIFQMGHIAEKLITSHLAKVGIRVWADQEEVVGYAKHALGHVDGRAMGFPEFPDLECLAEFKTANAKYFKEFQRKGCKIARPVYYAQVQYYMGRLCLSKCFFVVICKDNSDLHVEFIDFDKSFYDDLCRRERDIITSEKPMNKQWKSGHYECDWCEHKGICHEGDEPEKNCRTCSKCDIEDKGLWSCNLYGKKEILELEKQRVGCSKWSVGWGL